MQHFTADRVHLSELARRVLTKTSTRSPLSISVVARTSADSMASTLKSK